MAPKITASVSRWRDSRLVLRLEGDDECKIVFYHSSNGRVVGIDGLDPAYAARLVAAINGAA